MQQYKNFRSILISGILLMLAAIVCTGFFNRTQAEAIDVFQENLAVKERRMLEITAGYKVNSPEEKPAYESLYRDEKLGIYIFSPSGLVYWNNSVIPLKQSPALFAKARGVLTLSQGAFIYLRENRADSFMVVLAPVYHNFQISNKYLTEGFEPWTGLPGDLKISSRNQGLPVKSGEDVIFYLQESDSAFHNARADTTCFILFGLGYILLLIALVLSTTNPQWLKQSLLLLVFVFLLRTVQLTWQWPEFLYRTVLYDVSLFGNAESILNGYLGDILLNALTLLFICLSLRNFCQVNSLTPKTRLFVIICWGILLLFGVNSFSHTVKSLVTNSTFSFDFLDIFNMKAAAFVGLIALGFYALALFVGLLVLHNLLMAEGSKRFLYYSLICLAICLVNLFVFKAEKPWFEAGWFLIFSLIMYITLQRSWASVYLVLGIQILVITIITSGFLNIYIEKDKEKELEILALKLSQRQDPVLENEFAVLPLKISQDQNLMNLLRLLPASAEAVQTSLHQKYFSGYFDRYDVEFALFDSLCQPLLDVKNKLYTNEGYFDDQLALHADRTGSENLFFMRDYLRSSQYMARISVQKKNLFVVMEARQFEESGSFPDLLMDQSQQKQDKLRSFSHAVYREEKLSNRLGDLNYPFFLPDSAELSIARTDFIHRYFNADDRTRVIISERNRSWTYFFTFNSYLLLFFSLLCYFCYLTYAAFFTSQFQNSSLTRRIQTVIIVLLLLGMSAIGFTSGTLITGQFESDNKKQLEEKTRVIISELSENYTQEQLFEPTRKDLINLKLKEYARLFNTPISLFDSAGRLFNTSEPKLYELGLAAELANPRAYRFLKNNRSSSLGVQEKAGTLSYLSYYTPLFDSQKKLLGLVNLPYFAKQTALETELSSIISALINVYVILFVISIFAGLILTGYITQPLRLIKQQLANISFGKQNEQISWQSNDEIGKLVSEYNLMLSKLEESATLLARSERESAWREMAKQVAHEIKNPLTPMKLNLQYLQHVMKEDPVRFHEKFEQASRGIIEQIDSLAAIATEFSNFAKLPSGDLQKLNLTEILDASVAVFDVQQGITVRFVKPLEPVWILANRDQCLRVFNNLIKNAVQAMDEVTDPVIEIVIEQTEEWVTVAVKDNGCGISENLRSKLFTPNFTTKSTGSGLGLAMVKNIVEGFGGKIWFENNPAVGVTFYVAFKPAG